MKKKCKKKAARKTVKRKLVKKVVRKAVKVKRSVRKVVKRVKPLKLRSYGVRFTRRKVLSEIRGPRGWVSSPGQFRVSARRFATQAEAVRHGKRFTNIENHKSYSIFRSTDKVNARVNPRTGKTNPIIGLGRTRR